MVEGVGKGLCPAVVAAAAADDDKNAQNTINNYYFSLRMLMRKGRFIV